MIPMSSRFTGAPEPGDRPSGEAGASLGATGSRPPDEVRNVVLNRFPRRLAGRPGPAPTGVVVAVDDQRDHDRTVDYAAAIAGRLSAELTVAALFRMPAMAVLSAIALPEVEMCLDWELAMLHELGPSLDRHCLPWRLVVVRGDPARQLACLAGEYRGAFIVLPHSQHLLARRRYRRLGDRLYRHYGVPVLVPPRPAAR